MKKGNGHFKIERGIPVPECATSSPVMGILKKLKVGDSFVVPLNIRHNVPVRAQRVGVKVTTRKISESEVRVWRIK